MVETYTNDPTARMLRAFIHEFAGAKCEVGPWLGADGELDREATCTDSELDRDRRCWPCRTRACLEDMTRAIKSQRSSPEGQRPSLEGLHAQKLREEYGDKWAERWPFKIDPVPETGFDVQARDLDGGAC